MSIERMLVVIDAQTESLRREFRRADKATGAFQKNSSRHLRRLDRNFDSFEKSQAKRLKKLAGLYAGFAVARGVTGGFGSMVSSTANLQTAMNQLEAVSGATGNQLAQLRKEALRLGASTQYTAGQVAGGMNELAKAGQKADKILGTIAPALMLATSAQVDMAQASDIVTNVMAGFGHNTQRLEKDIDTLVATFTGSNTVITELGDAFKYAGSSASNNNFNFEQTAAVFAMMANAGIKGEMAGTSLRGAIVKMVNPSKEAMRAMQDLGVSFTDSSGHLRKFSDILRDLQPHYKNTQFFAEVFGQRAMNAMQILARQGGDALDIFAAKLEKSGGVAKKIADVQMKGLTGASKELTSALEGLSIEMDDRSGLVHWLEKITRSGAMAARTISSLSKVARGAGNLNDVNLAIKSQEFGIDRYINSNNSFRKFHMLINQDQLPDMKRELETLFAQRRLILNEEFAKDAKFYENSINAYVTKRDQARADAEQKSAGALSTQSFWKAKTEKSPIISDLTSIDREITAMRSRRDEIGMSAGELARLNVSRQIYNRLQDKGIALTNADTHALENQLNRLREAVNANAEYENAMQNLQAVSDVVAGSMTDAFATMAQTGKLDFKNMVSSMLADLAKLAFQMSVIKPLFGSSSGGGGGLFGSLLGGITGLPARAAGGPVSAGQIYKVNELGPELFMPNVSGTILTAGQTRKAAGGGGGAVNVSITNNFGDDAGPALLGRIDKMEAEMPSTIVKVVNDAQDRGIL